MKKVTLFLFIFILLTCLSVPAVSGEDVNFIGVTESSFGYEFVTKWGVKGSDDGEFSFPRGVAVDNAGKIYVTDWGNNRVQKFTGGGTFEMKWGTNGTEDGNFRSLLGIAVDDVGNVFVADSDNSRIQKFTSEGSFVTKWGKYGFGDGEFKCPSGIAIDGLGNVYVIDWSSSCVQKFTSDGTFEMKWGTNSTFPNDIAFDSAGSLYITDTRNDRIQKFTTNGTLVKEWGSFGTGDGEFSFPRGIAVDSTGNVYVADGNNCRIQKFTSEGSFLTKWGSFGNGDGEFKFPFGIDVDDFGNVYVADSDNSRVQVFRPEVVTPALVANFTANTKTGAAPLEVQFNDTSTGIPTSWLWNFGNGNTSTVQNPVHTYHTAGNYTVNLTAMNSGGSDTTEKMDYIEVTTSSNEYEFMTKWGSPGSGDGEFYYPFGIAVDGAGMVYVSDTGNHRIQKFTSDGTFVTAWGTNGMGDGDFYAPHGIAVDSLGNAYVADRGQYRIQKFTSGGTFAAKWGIKGTGDGEFNKPEGITVDNAGNVYVADTYNNCIQKFTSGGTFLMKWGSKGTGNSEFNYPSGIAVDGLGSVYVADTYNHRIQKFTGNGTFVTKWDPKVTSYWEFNYPHGITVDGLGNVYVADSGNHRIQKLTGDGILVTKWGTYGTDDGEFDDPCGIAVDGAGNVYVIDTDNERVQVFRPGNVTPVPVAGFSANITDGAIPLAVQFTDASTGDPTAWSWSFGDGGTSADENPTYVYEAAGSYNVSLAVTNAAGTDTITKLSLINVTAPAPKAEFDFNRNFVALIDDNTFSAGNYTSELTYLLHAASMDMNSTLGDLTYIAQAENLSWIDYSAYATRNLTYVEWNFPSEYVIPGGSGFDTRAGTNFSEDKFYNHEFTRVCNATIFRAPGVQRTNLTVTFNDLDFESIFVGFASAKDLNMTTGIINTSVVTDAPLAEPLPSGGDYHLKLDKGALTAGTEYYFRFDTLITPNGSTVIHKPLVYVWEGINHESASLGETYKAEVPAGMLLADEYEFSVETNTSCDWSVVRQDNLISVLEGTSIKPNGTLPVADFSASPLSGAAIRQVNFTDISEGSPDTWFWDFGDGETSSEVNPVHNYTSSGKYSVTLAVSKGDAVDSITKADYITVFLKGDFNGNGIVDIGDVSRVAYMVVGLTPVDMAADFNGNGEVDTGDAAKIAWYFVGNISEL
ncbi:PKD domain-containing protein [Methanoplanus endosymbiosus]|uniref:PKD domain-containing protein n=1 Tax=Methanoplanus endosymbiosus TaxID=33865 RepID=A0A9E7PLV8_9EURY|nr:PKD domain-containing protein [Methanoplanus endosymbiosus]UUX92573.1 PKD domain-containing protein [Methanoplanus endosymbiosus]